MFSHRDFKIGDTVLPNVLVSCDHGLMIVNRFDNDRERSVGLTLLDHGNNSTVEADLTLRLIENVNDPIVFDVGANIGTYTSWIAKYVMQKNGKVYAFEPLRQTFQILCGNMAMNNIHNVYAHQIALGKEEKYIELPEVNFSISNSSFAAFSLDGVERNRYTNTNKMQRIKITTLDKFMDEWGVEKVDFIKIDAEGLDLDVLEGGINTINKFKPDLLVEYLNLGSSRKEDTMEEGKQILGEYLQKLGYNIYVLGHDLFATMKVLQKQ